MLLSAVSVLFVAQSSSEFPEGLMNNPVYITYVCIFHPHLKPLHPLCSLSGYRSVSLHECTSDPPVKTI